MSDNEDSFHLDGSFVARRKIRPIIDSDSEDEHEQKPVFDSDSDEHEHEAKDVSQDNINDSFEEEAPDKIFFSNDDVIDTTDDENQTFVSDSNEDIVESSNDEESHNNIHVFKSPVVQSPQKRLAQQEGFSEETSEQESNESVVEVVTSSIVEVSSDEEPTTSQTVKQQSIKSFLVPLKEEPQLNETITVTPTWYEEQKQKIESLKEQWTRTKNALMTIKLSNLPDKGKSLIEKEKFLKQAINEEKMKFDKMEVDLSLGPINAQNKIEVAWQEIEAGVDEVGPRTFGKKGIARFNSEKQLAVETLDHLHKSLDTCPTENDLAEDPKHLKVELMLHQKRALAWLLWRETQKPSGGLLADDMGLGKTLTMISLIMKAKENMGEDPGDSEKENYRDKYPGGTLVVCPASLINQWSGEIEKRTKRGLLSVELYHGAKRETKAKRLAKYDVVITTYGLIPKESDKSGPLFRVRWGRIILDESHQIRNYKSQTAEAVFKLSGKYRWALTGTPVHNKEIDMYSILKFLRCAPFDDLQVWKRWITDKSTGGAMRLHAVISTLMLRRTKAELMEKGSLEHLPERTWELISVKLEKEEMDVYQKVLIFSRTLFAQFLHQRAEKNQDAVDLKFGGTSYDPNGEYFKTRNKLLRLNRVKEVSQHEILVLLLRLRQICCHPNLIKQMLQGDEDLGEVPDPEEAEEMNLLEQLNKLNVNDDDDFHPTNDENVGLKEASKGFLNPSNPVFRQERASSKIKTLISLLKSKVSSGDKAIVVSQWTSLLDLIAIHLKEEDVTFDSLTGKTVTSKRMNIVDNFNSPKSPTRVLLLSLTAGGVGLNLVGANHLFLLDLHWNPQLESQAQDRIYRMGQKKAIFVYKIMAEDTIEERIKTLQDQKLEIANSMLTGSKRVVDSKLSLQDLKMLFDFK